MIVHDKKFFIFFLIFKIKIFFQKRIFFNVKILYLFPKSIDKIISF